MITLRKYTGYYHNRYDGYNSSWGVLMALGASKTADCFAGDDDYPDDVFYRAWMGEDPEIGTGDNDDFRETVLNNLDPEDIEAVEELEGGESVTLRQYWGDYTINIVITKERYSGHLSCVFDGHGPFPVTL